MLFVMVDTLRSDHLGLYGYERETAPFLSALASNGVLLEDVSAPCSWTMPSIATLFTSLNPSQHGVVSGNCRVEEDEYVSDVLHPLLPTLAEYFQEAGYSTFAAIRNGYLKDYMGFSQGFETYHNIQGNASVIASKFKNWIEGRKGEERRPFFAYLHFLDVHGYRPPPQYEKSFGKPNLKYFKVVDGKEMNRLRMKVKKGKFTFPEEEIEGIKRIYDGSILYFDTIFKGIANVLKEKGLWDRTLVVFTSDHGEEFYEHREFGHGHSMADNLLRIPLVFRFPENAHGGRRISTPTALVDVMPTLLDLCGISYPDGIHMGRSLVGDMLSGEPSDKDYVRYGELFKENKAGPYPGYYFLTQSLRLRDYHFLRTYKAAEGALPELEKLKKDRLFAAVLRRKHPELYVIEETLYDLRTDPGETRNQAAEYPEMVARMHDYLGQIDRLLVLYKPPHSEKMQVTLDDETIEDLKETGYIR